MRQQKSEIVKCDSCNGTGYKGKNICNDCNSKGERVIVRYYDVEDTHAHIKLQSILVKRNN